ACRRARPLRERQRVESPPACAGFVPTVCCSLLVRHQVKWLNLPHAEGLSMDFISTDEAARQLGVTSRRVVQLIDPGVLDGHRVKRDWLVSASSVRRRKTLTASRGRPMSPETARSLIDALDGGTNLARRRADLLRTRDGEMLASAIAQSVVVDVFTTRDPLAASDRLHLTGESALDQIASGLGNALVGTAREVHGYLQAASLEDLIDDAMLVRSDDGTVHIYRFRDG